MEERRKAEVSARIASAHANISAVEHLAAESVGVAEYVKMGDGVEEKGKEPKEKLVGIDRESSPDQAKCRE